MIMADEIAIMNFGVLQQLDSPHEIYNHPANEFVAGFVGSPPMNFMDCTFTEKNGLGFLEAGAFTLTIPDAVKKMIKEKATSSELRVGIRPEDISVHKQRVRAEPIKAEVYVAEPLGSEVILDLKIGDSLVKAKTSPDFKLSISEKIWVTFNKEKMHIFDRKTEKVII